MEENKEKNQIIDEDKNQIASKDVFQTNSEPKKTGMEIPLKIKPGSSIIETLLAGGYESDIITTIFGPAGAGKTLFCLLCLNSVIKENKKAIYIDSEGGFSFERLRQINPSVESLLPHIFFLKPTNFAEQKQTFEKLKDLVSDRIGLIIVDSISMLYRLELGKNEEVYEVNRELGQQIAFLNEIARKNNIPVLITNQVYSNFDDRNKINMVGGDILKYGSKCLIELQITPSNKRRAILRKHRSLPAETEIIYEIKNEGIVESKEGKGFKIF